MQVIYYAAVDWIAIAIVIIAPFVLIVISLVALVRGQCSTVHPVTFSDSKKSYLYQLKFSKALFGGWVLDIEEIDGHFTMLMFKQPFPLWSVTMVTTVSVNIIISITAVFFNTLLIDRRYDCNAIDIGFDCFEANQVRDFDYFIDPINCSTYTGNTSVMCYKFTLNLPIAAALAGGLMQFYPLLFTIPLYVIIKLSNNEDRFHQVFAYILQWIVFLIVLLIEMLLVLIDVIREHILGVDINNFFTYASLFITLQTVLAMPWSLAVRRTIGNDLTDPVQQVEKGIDNKTV